MAKTNIRAGDINLAGKKTSLLGCFCCEVRNLKEQIAEKEWKQEQRRYYVTDRTSK